ncbi:diguanylate cyclase domain protein [Ochrobactrum quorumnocens]|uniref:Diguanylate cyclase n=1 Tax=Ochrobactrum quorumnocens TaxID=271865 RepID=A0A248UFG1_9HYPH|nr:MULTISPECIES: diguanylate cyclase [Brucella]ASV85049.1 diguanylate cyclase domain protein [[Ochrobactrum] quorumnocens]KAA9353271.1 diguanylate cyclase [[Ochrobactrum] quorumnocens]MCV9910118.1 diguanylate cyclase [Brucella sp. HL-2]
MSIKDDAALSQLKDELERLRLDLENKEKLINEQAQTLSHFKKIYGQSSIVAQIGIWECTLPDEALTWSDYVYDIFELPRGAPLNRSQTLDCYTESSRQELQKRRSGAIAECSGFTLEAEITTFRGNKRWIRITASIECQDNVPVRIFGMKQDITDQKALFDRIIYLAEYDQMTGLANKSQFHLKLTSALEYAAIDSKSGFLLLIDLDGFKSINDDYGHLAGDACIKTMGERLSAINHTGNSIFRIGGDEFAVIAPSSYDKEEAEKLAQIIIERLCEPIKFGNKMLKLGASIGIAEISGDSASSVFINADTALYSAKAAGKTTFRCYQPGMKSGPSRIEF